MCNAKETVADELIKEFVDSLLQEDIEKSKDIVSRMVNYSFTKSTASGGSNCDSCGCCSQQR